MKRLFNWWADFRYFEVPWCKRCRGLGFLARLHQPVCHEQGDYEDFLRTLPR